MTGISRLRLVAAALLLGVPGAALAGPMSAPLLGAVAAGPIEAQYDGPPPPYGAPLPPDGYARPYGYYRPYGAYRPYAYGPGPRWYNNHFGPGAATERYIRRENYCRNKPERCR